MSKYDQSGVMPSKISFRFPGRRCSGNVNQTVADFYFKTITAADAGQNFDGYPFTKVFHEYMLALYNVGGGNPTNQMALDAFALQFAKDYYSWLGVQFDRVYSGVLNVAPVGFYDEIIIDYTEDKVTTRIHTAPYNDAPEELMHNDPANANCTDANNHGVPVSQLPCFYAYGPPGQCVSGHVTLTVYRICIIDGRLSATYVRTDSIT